MTDKKKMGFAVRTDLARELGRRGGLARRKYDIRIICNKCDEDVTKEGVPTHYRRLHPEVYGAS